MPKKLEDCVKSLMAQGKSKSSAFAICIKSTGLNPHSEEVKKAKESLNMNIKQRAKERIEKLKKEQPEFCNELDSFTDDNFLWIDPEGNRLFPYKNIDGEVVRDAVQGAFIAINGYEDQVPEKVLNKLDELIDDCDIDIEELILIDATEQFMEKAFENVEYKTITIVECKGAG